MSYHLGAAGATVTLDDLKQAQALAAQAQALATAAKAPTATTATKEAAIAAAKAAARAEMERQAKEALTINALLIKNAKVEMSQSGGKLSQVRWDFHAAQMRGARYVDLVPTVKAALDAKIVGILGPRPGVSLVTLPGTVARDPRMPTVAPSPAAPAPAVPVPGAPVVIPDVRPDSPPPVDAPPPRGSAGSDGDNTMLYVGGAAVVVGLLLFMKRR